MLRLGTRFGASTRGTNLLPRPCPAGTTSTCGTASTRHRVRPQPGLAPLARLVCSTDAGLAAPAGQSKIGDPITKPPARASATHIRGPLPRSTASSSPRTLTPRTLTVTAVVLAVHDPRLIGMQQQRGRRLPIQPVPRLGHAD